MRLLGAAPARRRRASACRAWSTRSAPTRARAACSGRATLLGDGHARLQRPHLRVRGQGASACELPLHRAVLRLGAAERDGPHARSRSTASACARARRVGLYTIVGVPPEQAVLIPIVGFTRRDGDLLARWAGAADAQGRLRARAFASTTRSARRCVRAQIERVPESDWPRVARGAALGLGAGLLAGLLVGLGEAWAIVAAVARPGRARRVVLRRAHLRASCCGAAAARWAAASLALQRALDAARARCPKHARVRAPHRRHRGRVHARDRRLPRAARRVSGRAGVEERRRARWCSLAHCWRARSLLYAAAVLRAARAHGAQARCALLLRPVGLARPRGAGDRRSRSVASLLGGERAARPPARASRTGRSAARGGNVLFIVVDTLRADHLPSYGYSAGKTPQPRRLRQGRGALRARLRQRLLDAPELRLADDGPLRLEPRRDVQGR